MAIVDTDEFKEYHRIDNALEDDLVDSLIAAAETAAMNWCRVTFDESADETVKLAIKMYAGYNYEHRSDPDPKGYDAMIRAFKDMLSPYADPMKMI